MEGLDLKLVDRAGLKCPVVRRGERLNRFHYYRVVALVAVALLLPVSGQAQTESTSVVLKGAVSGTVAPSLLPNSTHNNIEMNVVSSGSSVRMTLSGTDTQARVIRLPLIVRSNSGFRISVLVDSTTVLLTQMLVTNVSATGKLVSPAAISELDVPQRFDLRGLDEEVFSTTSLSPLDVSHPLFVLSGPRISLGGTLDSPNNALQITLLIRLKPQTASAWLVHLTFAGSSVNTL